MLIFLQDEHSRWRGENQLALGALNAWIAATGRINEDLRAWPNRSSGARDHQSARCREQRAALVGASTAQGQPEGLDLARGHAQAAS
jgi:hypothetical protein